MGQSVPALLPVNTPPTATKPKMSPVSSLCLLVSLLPLSLASVAPSPTKHEYSSEAKSIKPLQLDPMSRTLEGIDLGTVALVVVGLIVLDVVGTLLLAGAVNGRKRSGSGDWDFSEEATRLYNSIDVVEMGLSLAGARDEACRMKTICQWEQRAASTPGLRLIINTINSNLSGLSSYKSAVSAGLAGQDYSVLYSQCGY